MKWLPSRPELTDFLDDQKIPYRVKYHSKPVFTSEDAAIERGVRLSQIVKTMLLADGNDILVAVLPSHRRLDVKKLKKLSGHKNLQFMDKESIERRTGLIVGAVAPIGRGCLKGSPSLSILLCLMKSFSISPAGIPMQVLSFTGMISGIF